MSELKVPCSGPDGHAAPARAHAWPSSGRRCRRTASSWASVDGVAWFAVDVGDDCRPPAATGRAAHASACCCRRTRPAMLAYARGLAHWHRGHRFCGCCGAATVATQAGHARSCPACGRENFPAHRPGGDRARDARRPVPARPLAALSARHVLDAGRLRGARRVAGADPAPRGVRGGGRDHRRDRLPRVAAVAVPAVADAGISCARPARPS